MIFISLRSDTVTEPIFIMLKIRHAARIFKNFFKCF